MNEYHDKLVCVEDEKEALKATLLSDAERLEDLLTKNAATVDKINELQQKVNEGVKQH